MGSPDCGPPKGQGPIDLCSLKGIGMCFTADGDEDVDYNQNPNYGTRRTSYTTRFGWPGTMRGKGKWALAELAKLPNPLHSGIAPTGCRRFPA